MPYGRPPIRRRTPRHGFTSSGYVENLPERQLPPTDYRKIMRYVPQGIMTFLGGQIGGLGGALTGYSAYPTILQILREHGLLNQ